MLVIRVIVRMLKHPGSVVFYGRLRVLFYGFLTRNVRAGAYIRVRHRRQIRRPMMGQSAFGGGTRGVGCCVQDRS